MVDEMRDWRRAFVSLACVILCFGHSLLTAEGFDHNYTRYNAILKHHVRDGLVDYSAIRANRPDLDRVLVDLGSVGAEEYGSWTMEQQLAFWVNAYNIWMIAIVADRYPINGKQSDKYPANSVQQIPGVWDSLKFSTIGRQFSLNEMEHEILRKKFREPRIHFVLICASLGCPKLGNEALRPVDLKSQLDNAARRFVQDPSKIRIDAEKKQLWLSSIFQWFPEDFDSFADEAGKEKYGKYAGPVEFVSRYLTEKDGNSLRAEKWTLQWLNYDWTINEKR